MVVATRSNPPAVTQGGAASARRRVSVEAWAVVALTVLAAVLRLATLSHQSFWFDEAQAVHEMRLSFGAMLHAWSTNEPNPPLYFVLAWPWAQVFGSGEAGLRSLSALVGTATVPLVFLAGRELISRRAGAIAAAFAALDPFMIWYSQEAREYMLLTALSAASLLFFARAWRRPPARRDLIWWTVFSGLALLTQYFAGFLVGAEALLLLYRNRNRAIFVALATLVVVEAALIPHLVGHISHPAGWIDSFSLSVRIRQVPVAFGFSPQPQGSSALAYGLLMAALLAGICIALLVVGANGRQLRGAGIAALLAGVVVLVPLVLALLGHDYYEGRALIPGWIPLAVLVGAACAAPGTRALGAALALLLCALFVFAQVKVDGDFHYQRPDWSGVAAALGPARVTRAIVAYDDLFATAPLAVYLPHTPWTGPGQVPQLSQSQVTVRELDIVGDSGQALTPNLPPGIHLISTRSVDQYVVDRFHLTHPVRASPAEFAAQAVKLLTPAPSAPPVLIQYGSH
jgi:hypothetical protein